MCSSKSNLQEGGGNVNVNASDIIILNSSSSEETTTISDMNGRPVLQPATSNRVPLLERQNSLKTTTKKKKTSSTKSSTPAPIDLSTSEIITTSPKITKPNNIPRPNYSSANNSSSSPPISPKLTLKSPRQPAIKRSGNDPTSCCSTVDKVISTPRCTTKPDAAAAAAAAAVTPVKKSKKCTTNGGDFSPTSVITNNNVGDETNTNTSTGKGTTILIKQQQQLQYSSSSIVEAPGSIAAARREQVAVMQVQRKLRIAHYGRSKSAKYFYDLQPKTNPILFDDHSSVTPTTNFAKEEKRCSFITPNSDPIYVAYHDQEWGVAAHDDKLLFELLVLTSAQVGSDWTSVLKKRQAFRDAFSGFDAEIVSEFSEKKITSITADYGIQISLVRGVVDNSNRILEIKKAFGSFDKYLWGFVNHKPISTQYKSSHKIPVKTSKSEAISKDMVRRGFRLVGPTVIHSFMQAAGLTNGHLTTCPRHQHLQCSSQLLVPAEAPAAL